MMLIYQAIEENVEKKACIWKSEWDTFCIKDHIEDHGTQSKDSDYGKWLNVRQDRFHWRALVLPLL